jgi:hypothetical protein
VPPALVYTGPQGPSQVQAMLPLASIAPPSRPPVAPVARTTSLVWRSQPGGRRVRVIRVGEPYDPAREGEYALLEAWLSGSSGVVYEAVREAAGASYVANAEVARGEPVITTATVSLSRSGDAVAAAELLHAALTRTQVSDADWERVRATALARSEHEHIPFRALGERVRAWLSLGLEGADPRELAAAQLLELDREAFEALLAAEAARPLVIELPRPSSNGRMERLRALGDVLEGEQVALPR